jgi:hypothetical protein
MVLNDDGLPQKDSENHWQEKRASEVDNVRFMDQADKRCQIRLPHDGERQY